MNNRNLMTGTVLIGISMLLSACASPKPGMSYEHANNAIRAAEIAGATTYAPTEYSTATQNLAKAVQLINNNRQDRAQKLLEVAIAQADLAKAISEAEHAEASLRQLQASN